MRRIRSDQDGFTLVEMLIVASIGLVVGFAMLSLMEVTLRGSTRVTGTVAANQKARPTMQKVMDRLNSSCVGSYVAPVQAGSDGNSMSFVHANGSAVEPVPVLRRLTVSGGALDEQVFPATGGSSPVWTFSGTPSETTQLLDGLQPPKTGEPPTTQPYFRYYAYVEGAIPGEQLPTPLSTEDAERVVQVTVGYGIAPPGSSPSDKPVTIVDSSILRFSPAARDTSAENLPCA